MGFTVREIAWFLGVSERSLFRFARCKPVVMAALKKGRAEMCVRLRRAQIDMAMNGNVLMQIWLGKQLLDQRDA
jgi:hypothetical protein